MIDWHTVIWNILADGNTSEDIKSYLYELTDDFIDEVSEDYKKELDNGK